VFALSDAFSNSKPRSKAEPTFVELYVVVFVVTIAELTLIA
jgi:hypothetical protein